MAKRFDTEPDTPGDDDGINALITTQLQQKIAVLESKIKELESKIAATIAASALKSGLKPDDTAWLKNEKSLGRIAGTIPDPVIGLEKRLEDDVS